MNLRPGRPPTLGPAVSHTGPKESNTAFSFAEADTLTHFIDDIYPIRTIYDPVIEQRSLAISTYP